MTLTTSLARVTDAARDVLLGISAYTRATPSVTGADPATVDRLRTMFGGLLTPPAITPTRWYMSDLEQAEQLADMGDLRRAGQLMLAARKDGHLAGVLSTRTGGLVRLPRQFRGDEDIIHELERGHYTRAAFDDYLPPSELSLIGADGLLLGAGIGEFVPVRNRRFPVLVRLDPQFLRFIWSENRWFYSSIGGLIPITPGDGRWFLYTPFGRIAPWQTALWRAVGQAWIRKQHAALYRDNWEAKLAHPARVAVAPQGAAEVQKQGHFQQVMAWGLNTVFGMTPGYDVKLIESNGRGWESFTKTIEQCNEEFKLAVCGQVVTTDGGAGFSNSDIHKSIRADLIKETADSLAYAVNTQALPQYVAAVYGADAVLERPVAVEWDVTPPKDRNSEATYMVTVANATTLLTEALAPAGLEPDARQLVDRFHIPVRELPPPDVDDGQSAPGGAGEAQDAALNGAQIASLLQVVTACAAGQLPRDAAAAIIARSFLVPIHVAEALLGSVGAGFVPASAAPAPAAPAAPALPADAAPDPAPEPEVTDATT